MYCSKSTPAPPDALEQHVDGRLQVDHQIGLRRADVELGIQLLVERVFVVIERDAREQPVLLQQIVRNAYRREQVRLVERGELLRALQQEVQLRRQGRGARVPVEALEERVLRRLLQHRLGGETLAQAPRQARLADADRSFDHDELVERFVRHVTYRSVRPSDVTLRAQLGHAAQPGQVEIGGNFRQRIQNEVALHYPGMGKHQRRVRAPLARKTQQIQVDHPRSPAHALRGAAHDRLDGPQFIEQRRGAELGEDAGGGVDEVRLGHRTEGARSIQP